MRLEPILAEQIIDQLAPADLRRLRELARRMAQQSEPARWAALNRRFQQAMYANIERRHALRIVRQLIDLVEPYSHRYLHQLSGLDRASGEHHAMLDAIEQRDANQLEGLIRDPRRRPRLIACRARYRQRQRMTPILGSAPCSRYA